MPIYQCICDLVRSQANPSAPLMVAGAMCRKCAGITNIPSATAWPQYLSFDYCGCRCGCCVKKGEVAYCYALKADFGSHATTSPATVIVTNPSRANVKPRFIIPHVNGADNGKCTAGKKYECLFVDSCGVAEYIGDDGNKWAISSSAYTPVYDNEPVKTKSTGCDCGAAKCGYGPGINHSHWNHPNDKSKWCPMRVE